MALYMYVGQLKQKRVINYEVEMPAFLQCGLLYSATTPKWHRLPQLPIFPTYIECNHLYHVNAKLKEEEVIENIFRNPYVMSLLFLGTGISIYSNAENICISAVL